MPSGPIQEINETGRVVERSSSPIRVRTPKCKPVNYVKSSVLWVRLATNACHPGRRIIIIPSSMFLATYGRDTWNRKVQNRKVWLEWDTNKSNTKYVDQRELMLKITDCKERCYSSKYMALQRSKIHYRQKSRFEH